MDVQQSILCVIVQGVVLPVLLAMVITGLVTPLCVYLLVYPAHYGAYGAALSNGVIQALTTALLGGVFWWRESVMAKEGKRTWHGW